MKVRRELAALMVGGGRKNGVRRGEERRGGTSGPQQRATRGFKKEFQQFTNR